MDLLVGCPVYRREWIIEPWLNHVMNQNLDLELLFIVSHDDPTLLKIKKQTKEIRTHIVLDYSESRTDDDSRFWSNDRYKRMVDLRNRLLKNVRDINPDYFISLDSDILAAPGSIGSSISFLEDQNLNAVASKVYLDKKRRMYPNYSFLPKTGVLRRPDVNYSLVDVDVIMAFKIMDKKAYNIDYKLDKRGEDIGWSLACREKGLRLGFNAEITSKHVMNKEMLDCYDERCGY
jgi:hypothetical protein